MAVVTAAAIAAMLGRPLPTVPAEQITQWEQLIGEAEWLVERRLGDLAVLDQRALDYVVRHAVAAHIRRPDDATQVDVQVDGDRVSKRYETGHGRVRILDEWWAMLTPKAGPSGAFSVRPTFRPDVCWP